MRQPEHIEQAALFTWARAQSAATPELRLMYAIPNGGHRHKATAGRLKAEGVKAGVPDVCLPVARGPWHGLYLEMKAGKNRPTEKQRAWLSALSAEGYATAVAYGFEEAQRTVSAYLDGCFTNGKEA